MKPRPIFRGLLERVLDREKVIIAKADCPTLANIISAAAMRTRQ
ncbi:MAG: hypothetical protein WAU00_01930 [Caldilinea sp.]